MDDFFPIKKINLELHNAFSFAQQHEYGKSRVCARKAAGYALRYWLFANYSFNTPLTPFDALEVAQRNEHTPKEILISIDHLLMKVDINYHFPDEIDLIKEAKSIVAFVNSQI